MGKQFGGERIGKRDPPPCPPRQSTVALLTQHATKHRTMAEPLVEPHDDEVRFRLIAALFWFLLLSRGCPRVAGTMIKP